MGYGAKGHNSQKDSNMFILNNVIFSIQENKQFIDLW